MHGSAPQQNRSEAVLNFKIVLIFGFACFLSSLRTTIAFFSYNCSYFCYNCKLLLKLLRTFCDKDVSTATFGQQWTLRVKHRDLRSRWDCWPQDLLIFFRPQIMAFSIWKWSVFFCYLLFSISWPFFWHFWMIFVIQCIEPYVVFNYLLCWNILNL